MAVPGAALPRTTTVTLANPTPPTNVPVVYQGTPPTQSGLVPQAAPVPLVTPAGIFLCADPLNGAIKPQASNPTELAGKAEADGTEVVVYYPTGATGATAFTGARATDGNYTETPNASHPSYGT